VFRRLLILLCLVVVPLVMLGLPAWTGFQVWVQSHRDEMHRADAIVVLGAAQYAGRPSPVLKARLDHALYLYQQGMAPVVVTTGGKQAGDLYTEADVGFTYLARRGVPASDLMEEDTGRTTYESMEHVAGLAQPRRIHTVLLVTDPLSSARVRQMTLDLGFRSAYTSPANYLELNRSTNTKLGEFVKETSALTLYELGLDRG
jgi:uncharacterized SAM-binding protein YcdF (DUF218 family)